MEVDKTVITDFSIEGFHNYPNAPLGVEFLKYEHRHNFQIRCGYEVSHSNREKEIFLEQEAIKNLLVDHFGDPCIFGSMSCEMIAELILECFYPKGMIWCEVFEDGLGGARVAIRK